MKNKLLSLLMTTLCTSGLLLSAERIVLAQDNHSEIATSSKQIFNNQNLQGEAIFFCDLSEPEVPTTTAIGNDGKAYPIIQWISTFESLEGGTPEERCRVVSQNFQNAHENGSLKYLRGGIASNGLPMICATNEQKGACLDTLFSLPFNTNANQTVSQLWQLSEGRRGPLYQTGNLNYLNIEDLVPLGFPEESETELED